MARKKRTRRKADNHFPPGDFLIRSTHNRSAETDSSVDLLYDDQRKADQKIQRGEDACQAADKHDDQKSDIHKKDLLSNK